MAVAIDVALGLKLLHDTGIMIWPWLSETHQTTPALGAKQVQAGPGMPLFMEQREAATDQAARRMPVPPSAAAAGERRMSSARQHPSAPQVCAAVQADCHQENL